MLTLMVLKLVSCAVALVIGIAVGYQLSMMFPRL